MNEQLHSHKTIDHYDYLSIPLSKLNQIIRRDMVTYVINSRRPFWRNTKLLEPLDIAIWYKLIYTDYFYGQIASPEE